MKTECRVCPHHCKLSEGQTGRCHARMNKDGKIICKNYGELTSIALDPIEKKTIIPFLFRQQNSVDWKLWMQYAMFILSEQ